MNRFEEIVRNIKGDMVYIQTHLAYPNSLNIMI